MPLISGIRMSRMIAVGVEVSAICRPTAGSSAVATLNPSSFSSREKVSTTDWSSSTMRMLLDVGSAALLTAAQITLTFWAVRGNASRTDESRASRIHVKGKRARIPGFLMQFGVILPREAP